MTYWPKMKWAQQTKTYPTGFKEQIWVAQGKKGKYTISPSFGGLWLSGGEPYPSRNHIGCGNDSLSPLRDRAEKFDAGICGVSDCPNKVMEDRNDYCEEHLAELRRLRSEQR
jgi:hypothetical protein